MICSRIASIFNNFTDSKYNFWKERSIYKDLKNLDEVIRNYSVRLGTCVRQLKFLINQGN